MARKVIEKNISFDTVRGLYYINMDYGKDSSGKRIKKTKSFTTKKEAQKALKVFEGNKTKGKIIIPTSETLEAWLTYWIKFIKKRTCEETTLYAYNIIINNHIIPVLGKIELQKLTPKHFNEYFTMLETEKKLTSNTIRKHYDLLKNSLSKAEKEEKISKNPLNKVDPPKVVHHEKNYYTPEQLSELFSIVEENRMEVVVKLAGYLGLRREEIAALKWANVDFDNQGITIKEARTQAGGKIVEKGTKNFTSYRTLSATSELIEVLNKVKVKQDENKKYLGNSYVDQDFVFAWEDGRPYRPNYISDLFAKIIKDNNLPYIRLHDLRHTFASIANSLNISLFDIGKALGHSSVNTTGKIYTHLFDKTHKKTIKNIATAINTVHTHTQDD